MGDCRCHIKMQKFYRTLFKSVFNSLKSATVYVREIASLYTTAARVAANV